MVSAALTITLISHTPNTALLNDDNTNGEMTPPAAPSALLTSLLNTLHSHLQTQTQHLPILHAQLGLPATALEDELKTLQNNLMRGVEAQIDLRRKEVEVWMEKCDSVENECLQYSKALGGNIKATGSSVGELRKENMLPKRYELGIEYQEKLRQLYHTKLEQLTNLTNRLNALARTLDRGFFPQDILEPTPVHDDGTSHRDVTPERFSRLEKELVRGKGEITKRLNHLSETFEEIYILYMELGISPPTLEDLESVPSPPPYTSSASSSTSLGKSLRPPHPSSDPFTISISTPTPASRTSKSHSPLLGSDDTPTEDTSDIECQRIFASFVACIEEAESEGGSGRPTAHSSSAPLGLHNVDPTPSLLSWAHTLQSNLDDTKRRRQAHIQAMFDQLEGLWRRLGVADEDMEAFVEVNKGTTEECVTAYEEELDRMLELKRERMSVFVGNARDEIERLWDELMTGEEERGAFGPFTDDEHTEELLLIHEEEIRKLKEEKRLKAPLLNSIKKYFDICEEEKELAAAASDQTRLLGRGARDPGRLLREEKMRKRVMKEKPRLEQDLLTTIPAWEQDTGRPFLVHGQSILRLLMDTISAADQENMNKRAGRHGGPPPIRGGSVPPRATTPVGQMGSSAYGKGVVTPAVRPAPEGAKSAPNKRMKMSDSGDEGRSSRAPFGAFRGNTNALGTSQRRDVSPSKIPGSKRAHQRGNSGGSGATSSLPRPVPSVAMPIPKPGTQHHALGHGRLPTGGVFTSASSSAASSYSSGGFPAGVRTASGYGGSSSTRGYGNSGSRYPSGGSNARSSYVDRNPKAATRVHRESFRPRPSMDGHDVGAGRYTGGFAGLREEDEDY
ncbi:Microtubule bundling protein [Paramarasmius palmivorus]|uniref:Microtubule bundling protein n=1 Tax=Paramarasmius palmivorus TaxID=297713 RepID=A0AAW0DDH8_9AGAR